MHTVHDKSQLWKPQGIHYASYNCHQKYFSVAIDQKLLFLIFLSLWIILCSYLYFSNLVLQRIPLLWIIFAFFSFCIIVLYHLVSSYYELNSSTKLDQPQELKFLSGFQWGHQASLVPRWDIALCLFNCKSDCIQCYLRQN